MVDRRYFRINLLEWISIQISLKFVPKNPIDNKSALVQVMAWCRTADKPLPEPMLTKFTDAYIYIYIYIYICGTMGSNMHVFGNVDLRNGIPGAPMRAFRIVFMTLTLTLLLAGSFPSKHHHLNS